MANEYALYEVKVKSNDDGRLNHLVAAGMI